MCKDHPNFAHTFALSKKKKSSADHELCQCAIYEYYSCPFSLMRNAILNELCAKHKLLARQCWCWRPKHGPACSAMAKSKKNCESHCLFRDHILSLQVLVLTSVSRNVLFSCMTIFVTSITTCFSVVAEFSWNEKTKFLEVTICSVCLATYNKPAWDVSVLLTLTEQCCWLVLCTAFRSMSWRTP